MWKFIADDIIYVVYTRVTYSNFDPTYKHIFKRKLMLL